MARLHRTLRRLPGTLLEVFGLATITAGIHQVYPPAALIFAGAALIFIAQGAERHE